MLLDVQKRHMEIFRIRVGDRDDDNNPRRLTDSMRVTSPSKAVVEAFTETFGGGVTGWETGHQAYLPITELPIMLLPGQSISAWWETYTGGVCAKRCDGETELLTGQPCSCPPDITVRMQTKGACKPMTRINFVCPDVAVVGAGALVTHSLIAAETLPQAVAVADTALSRGLMVPAVLRVVEHVGKKRRYIVPQLEIVGVSLKTLANGEVPRTSIGFTPAEPDSRYEELVKDIRSREPDEYVGDLHKLVTPPKPPAIEVPKQPKSPVRRPAQRPPLPGEDGEPAGGSVMAPADEAGAGSGPPPTPPAVLASVTEREALKKRLNRLDGKHKAMFRELFVDDLNQLLAKDLGHASDWVAEREREGA